MNMMNFVAKASKIVYFSSCGSGSVFQFSNFNFMSGCTVNSCGFYIISVPHPHTLVIQFCKFLQIRVDFQKLTSLGQIIPLIFNYTAM